MSDRKTEWAESRTNWAEDRTILANERTFAGWLRTGLAALAIAIGLQAIFGKSDGGYYPARLAASFFAGVAIAIFWIARYRAVQTLRRLDEHTASPIGGRRITILSVLMSLGALGTGVLLWMI